LVLPDVHLHKSLYDLLVAVADEAVWVEREFMPARPAKRSGEKYPAECARR